MIPNYHYGDFWSLAGGNVTPDECPHTSQKLLTVINKEREKQGTEMLYQCTLCKEVIVVKL